MRDCLENDLPKLQEAIRMEQAEREDYDTNFMKFVTEEMQKYSLHTNQFLNGWFIDLIRLHNTLGEEKKAAEETEEAMLEMLKEMINKMKIDIVDERKERESTEDTLLTLLEDTCANLQIQS